MATDVLFTAEDFRELGELVLAAWESAVDRDWSARAGSLEWTCLYTADHTIDCVFSYAFFLASLREDAYPNFGELHANPGAGASDMVDGLRAVARLLHAMIVTADPDERAIMLYRPEPRVAAPEEFAARGGLELILHAHDVCTGLGVPFEPPRDLCERLWHDTADWPGNTAVAMSDDRWSDLLARSGRARP